MKNIFTKIATGIVAICLSVVFVVSCSVEDLTKDLTLYTGNSFLVNPISIQVADAAKNESAPDQLTVTIEGRDKDKIFTMFGEKKIRAISGIVSLAVKTADAPTAAKPLEFTLVLSAPNFTTVRKSYSLTESAELKTDKVSMVNPSAPPPGVSAQSSSFTSSATAGTAQDVALVSPLSNGKTEQVNAMLKAGTKPLAADGSILSGAIQTQLIHFDTRSEASLSSLTEGFSGLTLKEGTNTGQVNIVPAGFYSMTMTAGTSKVSKFSEPMDVTMDIDPEYFDVTLNRKIQAGDVLDVISRDDDETVWTGETQATIVSVNGKLKATFKQPHLSTWVVGRTRKNLCQVSLKVSSDLPAASTSSRETNCSIARETFIYFLVNAQNPSIIYKQGTATLGNGEVLDAKVHADSKIATKLIILDQQYNRIYTSPSQYLCENSSVDLKSRLPVNKSVVVKLNISASCKSGSISTIFTPSNVTLFYRDMASPANAPFGGWSPLITIVDGKGCAKGLIVGNTYDFGLAVPVSGTQFEMQTFSKDLKQPKGLTIPEKDLKIDVVSSVYNVNTTFEIKKEVDGSYNLSYERYPLPDNICSELDKKFSVFLKK